MPTGRQAGDGDTPVPTEAEAERTPVLDPPLAVLIHAREELAVVLVKHDESREIQVDLPEKRLHGAPSRLWNLILMRDEPVAMLEAEEHGAPRAETTLVGCAVNRILVGLEDGCEAHDDGVGRRVVSLDPLHPQVPRLELFERGARKRGNLDHDSVVRDPETVLVAADDLRLLD